MTLPRNLAQQRVAQCVRITCERVGEVTHVGARKRNALNAQDRITISPPLQGEGWVGMVLVRAIVEVATNSIPLSASPLKVEGLKAAARLTRCAPDTRASRRVSTRKSPQ